MTTSLLLQAARDSIIKVCFGDEEPGARHFTCTMEGYEPRRATMSMNVRYRNDKPTSELKLGNTGAILKQAGCPIGEHILYKIMRNYQIVVSPREVCRIFQRCSSMQLTAHGQLRKAYSTHMHDAWPPRLTQHAMWMLQLEMVAKTALPACKACRSSASRCSLTPAAGTGISMPDTELATSASGTGLTSSACPTCSVTAKCACR